MYHVPRPAKNANCHLFCEKRVDIMDKYLLDCLDKVLTEAFSPAGWRNHAAPELAALCAHGCALHELEAGQPFIQGGFPARTVWVLVRGAAQVICYNRKGSCSVQDAPEKTQMFGLMEQLSGYDSYTATVVSSRPSLMFSIPAPLMMDALEVSVPLLRLALQDLCILAERAMNRTEYQALHHPRDNLAIFLHHNCRDAREFPHTIRITRREMAEQLHIHLRSLYRYLDDLKMDGLCSVVHGHITITREQADLLAAYCQGL